MGVGSAKPIHHLHLIVSNETVVANTVHRGSKVRLVFNLKISFRKHGCGLYHLSQKTGRGQSLVRIVQNLMKHNGTVDFTVNGQRLGGMVVLKDLEQNHMTLVLTKV